MSMSKQDFIALADTLRSQREAIEGSRRGEEFKAGRLEEWTRTVAALAEFCYGQNPAFMRARWLGYINGDCGKSGGRIRKAT